MNCEYCGSPAHVWYDCRKKPDGWKPGRMTAAEAGSPLPAPATIRSAETAPAKRGRGRPKTIKDMRAYKAQKAREYRAKKRAGK